MKSRRSFLKNSAGLTAGGLVGASLTGCADHATSEELHLRLEKLDRALEEPVLRRELFPEAVLIESVELLRFEDSFICRVRSTRGAEGLSVGNSMQLKSLWPVFTERLQDYFPGKDARDLEALIEGVYVYRSNYKLQGLALWVTLATLEFAILDLLGKLAGSSLGQLLGAVQHPRIAVYQANNFRGKSASESLEGIRKQVEESGARALKFKVGGRMSHNRDDPPGRSEELIPRVRQAFGEDMVIYADANGSYDVPEAIRMGRLMEDYRYDFFEEPVPFDWYEETCQVSRALDIPIAGGEQEPSMQNFRWLLARDALEVVQPDLFYFGGMVRSMKVARMAEAMGKTCTPHISGSGLGYLYMMHFVSVLPNAGPFHEFKGFNRNLPLEAPSIATRAREGMIRVPEGPGLGVELDPDFVDRHRVL